MKAFLKRHGQSIMESTRDSRDPDQAAAIRIKTVFDAQKEFEHKAGTTTLLMIMHAQHAQLQSETHSNSDEANRRALEMHKKGWRVFMINDSHVMREVQTPESMCMYCGSTLQQDAWEGLQELFGCTHKGRVHLKCADEWKDTPDLCAPCCHSASAEIACRAATLGHMGLLAMYHMRHPNILQNNPDISICAAEAGCDHVIAYLCSIDACVDACACAVAAVSGNTASHARVLSVLRQQHLLTSDLAMTLSQLADVRINPEVASRVMPILDGVLGEHSLIGERVSVCGIRTQVELNGMQGKVLRIASDSGRLEVQLDSGRGVRLKRENVRVILSHALSAEEADIRVASADTVIISHCGVLERGIFTRKTNDLSYSLDREGMLKAIGQNVDALNELKTGMYASALIEVCPLNGPRQPIYEDLIKRGTPLQILGPLEYEEQETRYFQKEPHLKRAVIHPRAENAAFELKTQFGRVPVHLTYIVFYNEDEDLGPDLRTEVVPAALTGDVLLRGGIRMITARFQEATAAAVEEARTARLKAYEAHEARDREQMREAEAAVRAAAATRRAAKKDEV